MFVCTAAALAGLSEAGKAFGNGFWDGATGLVLSPFHGAKNEGCVGFFKGVGKGVVGVAAKPLAGVLDSARLLMQGACWCS